MVNWERELKLAILCRLVADCEFFLKTGKESTCHFWTNSPQEQLNLIKEIYTSLEEKPAWLNEQKITKLEELMDIISE